MEEIEVENPEYKKARAPDELYSGGVGPCIVIGAIYCGRGYMMHEHPVGHDYAAYIEQLFADLRRDVKNKSRLNIWVIGGEIEIFEKYKADMLAGRRAVLEKIAKNKLKKSVRKIRWCKPRQIQSMRLIISENRAEIEEIEDDSDLGDLCITED